MSMMFPGMEWIPLMLLCIVGGLIVGVLGIAAPRKLSAGATLAGYYAAVPGLLSVEVEIMRWVLAAAIGAIVALGIAFLVVALLGALGGVPTLYEPQQVRYGWDGAQYGMLLFVAAGVMYVWLFPAILLVGAALGLFVDRVRSRIGQPARSAK